MRKTLHRFAVSTTDDAQVDSLKPRWKTHAYYASRTEAWAAASHLITVRHYRHVRVVEERIFSHN